MAVHIEFRTGAGPGAVSEIDPLKVLAAWLKEKLEDSGIAVGAPTRYDWGFEIPIHAGGTEYFAGLPSRKDETSNWHLFVDKRRSLRDHVTGRTMPADEPMALLIKEIIARDPMFKVLRVRERQ